MKDYNTTVRMTYFNVDWFKIKEACMTTISKYDEDIYWACVPQCVRCGACVEPFSKCSFYDKFSEDLTQEEQTNIMARYDAYNTQRQKVLSLKKGNK